MPLIQPGQNIGRLPYRLRLYGDGSAFVHYETWLGTDGVQPVRYIDSKTGVSTWVSDDWRALPTCWSKRID